MRLIFLLAITITSLQAFSQPAIRWDKTVGGKFTETFSKILQKPDGNYILAGNSQSPISGDKTDSSFGSNDIWLVELDKNGQIVKQHEYGGLGSDQVSDMVFTKDGGAIMVGGSNSGPSGNKKQVSRGHSDYWIIKLNKQGAIQWQRTYGGNGEDNARSVIETDDGGYLVGGESVSGSNGYKRVAKFSAVGSVGYTHFFGKDVSGFKTDGIGLIPILVGVRVYPAEQFFIGVKGGLGILTGGGSSTSGFDYQPHVGYNADKFQVTLGYNGLSKDGSTFGSIGLGFLYKF